MRTQVICHHGRCTGWEVEKLTHEDVTGVGYGICSFYPQGEDGERHFLSKHLHALEEELSRRSAGEDPYVRLARRSMESYIREGKMISVPKDADAAWLLT